MEGGIFCQGKRTVAVVVEVFEFEPPLRQVIPYGREMMQLWHFPCRNLGSQIS